MLNTTKTPDNSTEYSNSVIELHILVNHHPSKIFPPTTNSSNTKNLPQLGEIFVTPSFFFLNHKNIKITKVNEVLTATDDNFVNTIYSLTIQGFRYARNRQNLSHRNNFLNKAKYIILINTFYSMNIQSKNCASTQAKIEITKIYIKDFYQDITEEGLGFIIKALLYFETLDEFTTTNYKLAQLNNSCVRKVQYITSGLQDLGIINKDKKSDHNGIRQNNSSLVIKINIPKELILFFDNKKRIFLGTYIKTETFYAQGMTFKVALFNNVHDLENILKLKTDRIPYDDETSYFLKQLNAGDIISYTPSVTRPTIKGVKHPLNLTIHSKAETEENMTFFAKFDKIIETIHERSTTKEVQFSKVYNVNQTININHTWQKLWPDCLNSKALGYLKPEQGDCLCFKARVIKDNKGKNFLTDIHTILPMEAFYNNQYGAM